MLAAVGRIDRGVFDRPVCDVVALDPGTVVTVRDIIFSLAGLHTRAAADALGGVDQHAPPVIGHLVVGRGFRRTGEYRVPGNRGGGQQNQQLAAGDVHWPPPLAIAGLCGLWQLSQTTPPEWSAEATCGKVFGLALLASWQRTHRTATSICGG